MTCDLGWLVGRSLAAVILLEGPSWCFRFGCEAEIRADSPWRLIRNGRMVLGSEDHGQWYGRLRPIDAADAWGTILGGAVVRSAEVREETRDIIIVFETGDRLEIIPLSSGFESWQIASPGGTVTFAQGGGDLVTRRPGD